MAAPTRTPSSQNHITSPNEPFPLPSNADAATRRHRQGNFVISTRKLPISKAGPIEEMEARLKIPVPEMIFGDNLVGITHAPSGWGIEFTAFDALDEVDKDNKGGNMLQVAHAASWSESRRSTYGNAVAGTTAAVNGKDAAGGGGTGIMEVVRPFDWTYSTTYRGTVSSSSFETQEEREEDAAAPSFEPATRPIPYDLLKRRDPIRFSDEVVLYESELDDNGISMCSVKVRVHDQRMLLLCRLFMRLDNVVARVRDTRIYVDFERDEVTREYCAKEGGFGDLQRKLTMTGLRPDAVNIALRDANQVAEHLPIVEQSLESVTFAK